MENIEKKLYFCSLFDIYKDLLTEKQRKSFTDYYFLDLSLSEISENYEVSKNAVFDQIKKTEKALEKLEKGLSLYKKEQDLEKILKSYENKSKDNEELLKLIEEIRNME